MSWVTVIFSMSAASCLTLAGVHLFRWLRGASAWTSLLFSISATAAASICIFDLALSRAQTPAQFGEILRWFHLAVWAMVVSLAWFLRFYLGTGRTWLLWLVCGSRTVALVLNFLFSPNLNFREITALRPLSLLGETVSVPVGVTNPWTVVGQASLLLFAIYVVDATLKAWRGGSRGRSLAIGGMLIVGTLVAAVGSVLVLWFHLPLPYFAGIGFLGLVAVMSYELSGDLLHAARLGRELRESEDRNRAMLAAIPDMMFLFSKDGVYLDYHAPNPQDLVVLPDQFLGRNMRDIMPPQLAAKFSPCFDTVLRTGEIQVVEYMLPLEGKDRFFEAHIVKSGSDRLLSIVRDITERKRAEEALRLKEQDLKRSEERYREVVETQTELVCRHRADTTLTFVNEAYCRFFGRKRESLLGRKFLELAPPIARERIRRDIALLSEQRKIITVEYDHVLPDGNIAWLHWTACAIPAADGSIVEFQAIGRDITDRKRAEEATQNLVHASRMAAVGELTAMIAHELNQPLGAILAQAEAADALLDQPATPFGEFRDIIASIRKEDLRAVETIHRIRALSRKRAVELQPLDLNETVSDAIRLAQPDAVRRRVQIHLDLYRPLPPLVGDPVHLQHVLLNLVLNSMDAMSDNAESDRLVFVSTTYNGNGMILLAVRDLGHGIPIPDLPRVFDSFFTTKRDGMGLGLAIARSIVQLHSGQIWAENNPDGKGAIFHLALPTSESVLTFPERSGNPPPGPQSKSRM